MRQYSSTAVLKTWALTGKHHNQRHTAVRVAIGKTLYFLRGLLTRTLPSKEHQLTPCKDAGKTMEKGNLHETEKRENKIATNITVQRTNQDTK